MFKLELNLLDFSIKYSKFLIIFIVMKNFRMTFLNSFRTKIDLKSLFLEIYIFPKINVKIIII